MYLTDISNLGNWEAPKNWLKILTLDAHTGGEPLRIIVDGFPVLEIARKPFWDLQFEDFNLNHYNYHPAIKFDVAV